MHLIKYAAPIVISLSSVVGCALGEISVGVDARPRSNNLVSVNADEKTIVIAAEADAETSLDAVIAKKTVELAKYIIAKNNGVGDSDRYRTLFSDKIVINDVQYEIIVSDVNEREFSDSRVKDGLEIVLTGTKSCGPSIFLQDRGFDGRCDFGVLVNASAVDTFDFVNKFGSQHKEKYQIRYLAALDVLLKHYESQK